MQHRNQHVHCPAATVASAGARLLVALSCGGFQLFAVCAAQLLRSEITARDKLARANAELQAAQTPLG